MTHEKEFIEFINDRVDVSVMPSIFGRTKEWFCDNVPPEDVYTVAQLEEAVKKLITNPVNY